MSTDELGLGFTLGEIYERTWKQILFGRSRWAGLCDECFQRAGLVRVSVMLYGDV